MNIPASHFMPAVTIGRHVDGASFPTGRLADQLNSVKNSPDTASGSSSLIASLSASAAKVWGALGMNRLVNGLAWVGNAMGYAAQLGKSAGSVAELFDNGAKIAQYGISALLHDVMVLLKDQALPILDCWVNKVIDAGESVTLGEAFKALIDCIINNKEINQLFKDILTA